MASEYSKPETVRLFCALDISDRVRDGLETWGARELTDPALRPVVAENLHVTLCFLGRTEVRRVDEAAEAVLSLPSEPIRMRLDPRPAGKPARRPSVWALEADAPAAAGLQVRLAGSLESAGLYQPEKRPFWMHLTVARTRNEPKKRRPRRVEKRPGDLPGELTEPFDAVRVSLYRSDLRSDGAKYVSLASLNLPPSVK
jgi:RNA 2',3'-cyclic 3'-phosphodiesterase